MTVLITLTTAGADTGPFSLYSNLDSYTSAFETGVSKSALIAGYSSALVPDGTSTIRVLSTGTCTNYVDLSVITTTTTTTTTPPPTTTTTTTLASIIYYSSASTTEACAGSNTLTSVVYIGTPGICNATGIQGDQFVGSPAGSTVWVSDGVNVREATIDDPNVSGSATFVAACTSCTPEPTTTTTTTTVEPPPPTTTTTTTSTPVLCDEYYNNTASPITGVDYTDCNGTILVNQTVDPGQSICAQQGSVSGGGFLINLGSCGV